ncbi:tetraacyldisaccharide 4'-kinase [Luteimonas sp BLCC-B24]|uniref:tetraacyldisaccharide 4'-kinase n=1 Tax=Luteimonas sp. BLCC-B24 TaxID=3025317 RepID=UPI00234D5723|nr:tetraacyldisaccharide 4'-kinase [Luteimonas sp. BLCC-B24]MDC7805613.1 tetraacyldisaccharide 4'-kinase [Luteimonas sp. BLCC-B24]
MKPPKYWFDGRPPPVHARALARVYGAATRLRLKFLRRHRVSRPVLVVGNLIAGGSGKTPLTIAIVERLQAAGWTPGVASRGYGRDAAGTPRWVEPVSDPALSGDEPVLIAARTGAKVRVDADRVAAARALIQAGCDIVVCDDGLQHYRLRRDIEIEVIDGRRRYGNGELIPAGPLREPPERGARCDFRVLNTAMDTDIAPRFGEWPMGLETGHALPLLGGRPRRIDTFAGQRVHAVAGIGDPERFFDTLRAHRIAVVPHAFADHHRYTPEDLQFGSDLPVLMTEKDAVKCMRFAGERHFSVPVTARLPEAFWIALLDRLSTLR